MGAALLHQTFTTAGVAPARSSSALTVGAGLGLMRDLPAGFYLLARIDAQTYLYRHLDPSGGTPVKPDSGARVSTGLGKRW